MKKNNKLNALRHAVYTFDVPNGKSIPKRKAPVDLPTMCETCGKNPATEPHPCPFKSDIDGDSETLCTCCEECQYQCHMEI